MNKLMWLSSLWLLAAGLSQPAGAATTDRNVCKADINTASLDSKRRILVFGEIHGTQEGPKYVSDVVCSLLKQGLPVNVALEFPVDQEDKILDYLKSIGDKRSSQALLMAPFWHRPMQDGRSSAAMFKLIDNLRRLSQSHPRLSVHAIEPVPQANEPPGRRDAAMAENLSKLASPDGYVVALVGNIHASRAVGTSFDPSYHPMGSMIERPFYTFEFTSPGGSYWACTPVCGVVNEPAPPKTISERTTTLSISSRTKGYDGLINLGPVTSSPPAIAK